MADHQFWTPEHNSLYRNSPAKDLLSGHVVRYRPAPTIHPNGSMSIGLNFPAYAITAWVEDADKVAVALARDLNAYPRVLSALKACCARLEYLGEDTEPWTAYAQAAIRAAEAPIEPKEA